MYEFHLFVFVSISLEGDWTSKFISLTGHCTSRCLVCIFFKFFLVGNEIIYFFLLCGTCFLWGNELYLGNGG